MNRRNFFGAAAVLAAAPLYKGLAHEQSDELFDVIIIGGGLSGLAAADFISATGKRALLIEASSKLGGRVSTEKPFEDVFVDVGGQWIGKGHERMYALVARAGGRVFPTYTEGASILRHAGSNHSFRGETPPLGLFNLLALQKGINAFDKLSASSLNASVQQLTEWDEMSFGSWVDRQVRRKVANQYLKRAAEGELCFKTEDVSLLQVLRAAASTGSFRQAESVEEGALQHRIHGGAQTIVNYLASSYQGKVLLNEPVLSVQQSSEHVIIGTNKNNYRARKIIIAAPLSSLVNIDFSPTPGRELMELIKGMRMGRVVKTQAIYQTPFWREKGLNGMVQVLDEMVDVTVDNSVPGSTRGVLTSLIHADRADALLNMTEAEQKEVLSNAYVQFFGEQARKMEYFSAYSFCNHPWIGGAYTGFFKAGVFSKYGSCIDKPWGHIHFAGTETSDKFRGFMEGAVLSGERAAREVFELVD